MVHYTTSIILYCNLTKTCLHCISSYIFPASAYAFLGQLAFYFLCLDSSIHTNLPLTHIPLPARNFPQCHRPPPTCSSYLLKPSANMCCCFQIQFFFLPIFRKQKNIVTVVRILTLATWATDSVKTENFLKQEKMLLIQIQNNWVY